jgi:hypothetical protein
MWSELEKSDLLALPGRDSLPQRELL